MTSRAVWLCGEANVIVRGGRVERLPSGTDLQRTWVAFRCIASALDTLRRLPLLARGPRLDPSQVPSEGDRE